MFRNNWWIQYKWLLGFAPAILFLLFFFIGGFVHALWASFGNGIYESAEKGWAYKEILSSVRFYDNLWTTISFAFVVALLSGAIGLGVALFLARYTYRLPWLYLVAQLPVGIPHLFAAYMLSQLLLQTGWLARVAHALGFIESFEQFPVLVHDTIGLGAIAAYLWKEIPFIVLLVYPFIVKLYAEWEEIAKTLGASRMQLVRYVVVPLVVPLWVGGMWVVFAFALSAYEVPAILARTSYGMLSVEAWKEYTQFGLHRQPVGIALNVLLAIVAFIIGVVLVWLQKKWYEKGRRVW